jgi:hypothetical protein
MQTQETVAHRTLALGLIAMRSQVENGISYREGEEERFTKMGEDLLRWAKEQQVDQWLSKAEKKLHRKKPGSWTRSEIGERFWRIESMKALLWALQCYPEMPTYFIVGNVREHYGKVPFNEDVTPFLDSAKLRKKKELEAQRHLAKFLNWRGRTELFRLQGMVPPMGDTYEAVVARALDGIEDEGIPVEHDGVDILVDGVRFVDLEGDVRGNMMSICYERHLALEWLRSDDDWDDAHADT